MDKAPGAFRTISEVADEIDVPQHVLRFWESRFTQIRPMKRGGGRRFYRPEDVNLLRGVRHLLYGEGYTIRGVQRILREQGAAFVQDVWRAGAEPPPPATDADSAEEDAAAAAAQTGPDLSPFAVTSARNEAAAARREPMPAPAAALPPKGGISNEQKHKLRAALDELVACGRVLETALLNREDGDRSETDSRSSG